MTQHTISLIDVLTPPANRWLKALSRRKADLPVGVRVVRFSDADDDGVGPSDEVVGTIDHRARLVLTTPHRPEPQASTT